MESPADRRIRHPFAASVADRVDEQFFQHQVQLEFGFVVQGVFGAKIRDRGGKTLQFPKTTVE